MPPVDVMPFDDALAEALEAGPDPHLLLGNGFSIACRSDCFSYGALLNEATFDGAEGDVRAVFELLGTADFELVIEQLRVAATLAESYAEDDDLVCRMRHDAQVISDALAKTLAARHPDRPFDIDDDEYARARTFLAHFARVYTLNYDVLLYWAVMHEGDEPVPTDDGFRADDDPDADYVTWEPYMDYHGQRIFFLHGGLHLYDDGRQISKITWSRTQIPLIDQIREALATGRYPLIVTEGRSEAKEAKVLHNAYLNHALRSFARLQNSLFIYGHSLAANDDHVFRRIESGQSKIKRLYVSIYGDPQTPRNQAIAERALQMADARPQNKPLVVRFFDAASTNVW